MTRQNQLARRRRGVSAPQGRSEQRPRARPGVAAAGSQATLRLYCQGIGDCHLLRFTKEDGGPFWMLIDCGIHTSIAGGGKKIDAIVADIASVTKRLDVVVGTHEHWDHLSGFHTAKDRFSQFEIGEIWLGWTENPADAQARRLDKYKEQALSALGMVSTRLDGANALSPHLSIMSDGLKSLLGFYGIKGERVRTARDALVALAPDRVRYLEPTDPPITLAGLPNLRIYVLGPPRDQSFLDLRERAQEMYGAGTGDTWAISDALSCAPGLVDEPALPEDPAAPFDASVGALLRPIVGTPASTTAAGSELGLARFVHDHYLRPKDAWRRIDEDWLGVSADLALQLDNRTNNTSVVLAFEFIDLQRVMLFAADAQVGNWLSWQDLKWTVGDTKVTGPDLLERTVFYKVGHHGSHNATLKDKGLGLMKSRDLCAFIPTNEADAKKVKWGQMPFGEICTELARRADGRVIRADDAWLGSDASNGGLHVPSGSLRGLRHKQGKGLWVELDVA